MAKKAFGASRFLAAVTGSDKAPHAGSKRKSDDKADSPGRKRILELVTKGMKSE